ncbi:hypothetical protein BGZ99_000849 [Dissophora globulifera]|uniref:BTB domain-containing protein n=1 Tax=Dissophora globulifera TaxID=979702 RepID=A0A9P6RPD4_9FUNG|nr:hypothetical protein BGZ99_000849 [Dissophora globulifera]
MSLLSPAPQPLAPLTISDPRSFYTIVVSGENFPVTLSAIQYDAPNFFSDNIVKHMQGYYVAARDEVHLENLVMDAHFYRLQRLIENLRQTMFVNVSGTVFKISRETISNDSPNFFQLLEPFADRNLTPTFFCRSPELFKDILSHLQGYEIHIRDKIHRNNLLKEARYFKLNGLIQKLSLGTDYIYSGFPTKPEERIKPEVTMILRNIRVKDVLVKGWRDFVKDANSGRPTGTALTPFGGARAINDMNESPTNNSNMGSSPSSYAHTPTSSLDITMGDNNNNKEKIKQHNHALVQDPELQDVHYKTTTITEPLALVVEISNIELFAIWPGSVNSSMLGDQHLFVYRDHDLTCLNKICKHLGLQTLTMAANVVQLSPNIFFHLDGQHYKGQEELEPIIRKLALTSAKVTPPGRALRLFLNRALVRVGCRSGQLIMTIVKAEGWSSDKEYNACRQFLTDDKKELTSPSIH